MRASSARVRVALILPSTINDVSWSQSIYTSLKELQDEMGEDALEIAYTENMWSVPDAAIAIRDYASSGYNLVIAHGAQYGDSLMDVAAEFPEVSFAWGTTTRFAAGTIRLISLTCPDSLITFMMDAPMMLSLERHLPRSVGDRQTLSLIHI